MRIFLIGMPGSGKSYWMQQLAAYLGYDQVDMDRYMEKREGHTIPELFAAGEEIFREKEQTALEAVLQRYPGKTIIATGGGAPCYKDNLKIMKEAGCVIYLESNIEVLIANVAQQGIDRPLLANGSRKELAEKLSELYRKRKEIYEQAHLKITADKASLSTFAQAIEQYLSDNNLSL
jgi:shikimate kinase